MEKIEYSNIKGIKKEGKEFKTWKVISLEKKKAKAEIPKKKTSKVED